MMTLINICHHDDDMCDIYPGTNNNDRKITVCQALYCILSSF